MSRFEDSLLTAAVDLPPGWVHDPFSSSLTRLVFVHWSRPADSLSIALYPPQVPSGAAEQTWRDYVATQVPPGTALARIPCGEGPAVVADLHGKIHTRVAFIRGPRLFAIVEHRTLTDDAETTALLPRALATLEIPPNRVGSPADPLDVAAQCQRTAHGELQSGAATAAFATLHRALNIARDHWLASLVAAERTPDLRAAESVLTTLAEIALFANELRGFREAEHIAMRARRSLRDLLNSPEEVDAANQRWGILQQRALEEQARLLNLKEVAQARLLMVLRGAHLLSQGIDARGHGDLRGSASRGGEALTDFLLELAKQRQQAFIPRPAGSAAPSDPGDDAHNEVAACALQAAQLCYDYAMDRQDARTARDSAMLMTELTDATSDADAAAREAHLRALLCLVGALLFTADAATLAEADALMADATRILATLPDDPSLTAEVCRDHAWIKHYQGDMQAGGALCADGLKALDRLAEPLSPQDARMRRAISSLHSQFLLHDNLLVEAEAAARVAVDGVAEPISSNLLNLALVLDRAGRRGEALTELRRAFEVALPDNPLGEDVLRLLFVSSVLLGPLDSAGGLHLHAAAEALLDAQRLQFGSDADKVAFDENSNHLEIAQTLVGRLIDAGDLGGALAAADRGRARGLIDLLGPRQPPGSPPQFPSPPVLESDPVRALRAAGDFVSVCAARVVEAYGGSPPLDVPGIMAAVQAAGRPALVIQPERGRVHLFCVLPEATVLVATSPVPMAEVVAAMNRAQESLGVFATARSRGQLALADVDDVRPTLDLALAQLSDALIAPLTELLTSAELLKSVIGPRGLIIVPYRELALVPYALLSTPGGDLLIEQAPLVQIPSLAALASLQRRPPRVGRGCAVIGDPQPDPAFHLEPLAAAADEAKCVAGLLMKAGVLPAQIALRLAEHATAAQYRRDAADSWLVHLSCHAAAQEPASQSALYLTPTAIHDGQLMPHEIADVALADALVFLSACQTGLGRPTADGVIGLGRAFVEAGAVAVVVSLWRVVDVAALAMARFFYRAVLGLDGEATDAATGLQMAMLATRAALRTGDILTETGAVLDEHPAHWAPFILTGDGSSHLHRPVLGAAVP